MDLHGARLQGADLSHAVERGHHPKYAFRKGVDLGGADLSGANYLE